MHTCRAPSSVSHKICKFLMSVKFVTILSETFPLTIFIHLMRRCRLKAGFPTIFEIMSVKCEGGVKYICV